MANILFAVLFVVVGLVILSPALVSLTLATFAIRKSKQKHIPVPNLAKVGIILGLIYLVLIGLAVLGFSHNGFGPY